MGRQPRGNPKAPGGQLAAGRAVAVRTGWPVSASRPDRYQDGWLAHRVRVTVANCKISRSTGRGGRGVVRSSLGAAAGEHRDGAPGVLASSPASVYQALALGRRCSNVTLFLNTVDSAELPEQAWSRLASRGVRVVPGEVESLAVGADHMVSVRLRSGRVFQQSTIIVGSVLPTAVPPDPVRSSPVPTPSPSPAA